MTSFKRLLIFALVMSSVFSIAKDLETVESIQEPDDGFENSQLFGKNHLVDFSDYALWFENERDPSVGYTFSHCEDPNRYNHLIQDTPNEGLLAEECHPDVLYSWGSQKKIDWWKKKVGNTTWIKELDRELYLSQSPSGSYVYGPIAMRVKVKEGTQFRVRRSYDNRPCSSMSEEEKSKTIYVVSWKWWGSVGLDYVICSTDVIESWSYYTRRHFDEVVKDIQWVREGRGQYQLYNRKKNRKNVGKWIYFNGHTKRKAESGYYPKEKVLHGFLSEWLSFNQDNVGFIFYNEGIEKDPLKHFTSRRPIYYNEN